MLYRLFIAACYHLWMVLPFRPAASRFGLWLLAYAGEYAYAGSGIDWHDDVEDPAKKPF